MAEDKEGEKGEGEAEAAGGPKKSGKKLVIILALVAVLLVAGGVPAAFVLLKKAPPKTEELASDAAGGEDRGKLEGSADEEELDEGEEALGAIIPFDTFVVNLAGGKFVRVQLQVEFATLDVPRKFYSRMVPMRDSIISTLTQKTSEELETPKGKDAVKTQIRNMMNEMLRKEDVKKIYFTQFVIQ